MQRNDAIMIEPKISPLMSKEIDFENSKIAIFGAPFDGTTTYRPGARFASQAIRNEFYGLETYSPLLDKDLSDIDVFDCGDLELPFGNTALSLEKIYDFSAYLYKNNKIPVMIGGEHLVSLPAIKAAYEKYNDLRVIHLDAHTDLREEYMGETLSHSSVIRRVWDFLGDERIYQFGIRSGTREEFEWAKLGHTHLQKFNLDGLDSLVGINHPIYVTIDLDVLDPSIFSGTGTPEAGGIAYKELERLFSILQNVNIVGFDIVELAPHIDASGVSTAVACKVLREMILSL